MTLKTRHFSIDTYICNLKTFVGDLDLFNIKEFV